MDCLRDYVDGSCWQPGVVCAVCSRHVHSVNEMHVDANSELPLNLDILQLNDPFIVTKCVIQCLSSEFIYQCSVLDGLMLDKSGIPFCTSDSSTLNICGQCFRSLSCAKVPRFALANKLYRGQMPPQFRDLTWVEEMVCAIYRNMAHITRLYQSSDPVQPFIFHGNTCAHRTNLVSTAQVLPRTPADINGMLTVVFVGPTKLTPWTLRTLFHICKGLVWSFLHWLCNHNHLYEHIILDESVMDLYPEDGTVPGVAECVIYDHESDVSAVFSEETAGFSEHPAELFVSSVGDKSSDADKPSLLIESMGVSDHECTHVSGRVFTASALRNLLPSRSVDKPDLVLPRNSVPVVEYHNPDVVPGMFPSLYPFGIGGFDDDTRPSPVAFQKQANYYFDLVDRSFCYHRSYMFVVLNIFQH